MAPLFDVKVRTASDADTTATERFLATRPERELRDWLDEVPGAILPARLDPANPLAGAPAPSDGDARRPACRRPRLRAAADLETVAYFPEDLHATSGVISQEKLQQLEDGAWLADKRVGSGSVVLFADDPLFRLFWVGAHPLYENALLIGPSRTEGCQDQLPVTGPATTRPPASMLGGRCSSGRVPGNR